MAHHLAKVPEVLQPAHPSRHQAEIGVACLAGGVLEQASEGGIGNAVAGVVERVGVKPRALQQRGRVAAEFLHEAGQSGQACDAAMPGCQWLAVRIERRHHADVRCRASHVISLYPTVLLNRALLLLGLPGALVRMKGDKLDARASATRPATTCSRSRTTRRDGSRDHHACEDPPRARPGVREARSAVRGPRRAWTRIYANPPRTGRPHKSGHGPAGLPGVRHPFGASACLGGAATVASALGPRRPYRSPLRASCSVLKM